MGSIERELREGFGDVARSISTHSVQFDPHLIDIWIDLDDGLDIIISPSESGDSARINIGFYVFEPVPRVVIVQLIRQLATRQASVSLCRGIFFRYARLVVKVGSQEWISRRRYRGDLESWEKDLKGK